MCVARLVLRRAGQRIHVREDAPLGRTAAGSLAGGRQHAASCTYYIADYSRFPAERCRCPRGGDQAQHDQVVRSCGSIYCKLRGPPEVCVHPRDIGHRSGFLSRPHVPRAGPTCVRRATEVKTPLDIYLQRYSRLSARYTVQRYQLGMCLDLMSWEQ